ncbi:hypothetical protein D027_0614B, partial [Vibrio parahaemolyticus 861]
HGCWLLTPLTAHLYASFIG